jgi:hypothetical protein
MDTVEVRRMSCTRCSSARWPDEEALKTQRYAVSAGNELEVREPMLRYLGAGFPIRGVHEATEDEVRRYGPVAAGTINLLS